MGKIVYLMGKSSSGKDTVFKKLMKKGLELHPIVPYTTRPIRAGEENGVQYFFTDEDGFQSLCSQGKVIEDRAYHTMHGLWRYFTVDDGQILLGERSSIMIGTLEGYMKMKAYFGEEQLLPIMIELDDGIRLQRALDRERKEDHPKYKEMCRRFLADCEDFSEEKILEAGICRSFYNEDLEKCLDEIVAYIAENT
jgi:guanylate kinase